MRSRWIACARKARRFRRQRCGGICLRVKAGKQRLATGLVRDAHEGSEIVRRSPSNAAFAYATIAVAVKDPSLFVHSDFVEVEKVAVLVTTALLPNTGHALYRIVGRGVDCDPVCAAIVSRRDEGIPVAWEAYRLVIAGPVSAEE